LKFDIGVFTNISPEHLDFHETMDEYFKAKAKLFSMSNFAVINADDMYTTKLQGIIPCKYVRNGLDNESNITATDVRINNNYVEFKMYVNKQLETIRVSIPGRYSVYNALAAIAVTSMLGAQMQDILVALANIKVPGRSEIVDINKSFAVLIDYAHNASSLEAILVNTKKYIKGRVICVFGCGGDRDTEKRAEMGKIAGKYADFTIITTDNPRSEDPKKIIAQIEEGIKTTKGLYKVIINRKEAIEFSMMIAWKNDTVILAGKGHETYQELANNKKIHFDEREIVKKAAENMPGKEAITY
jgi:UDP-N-acetylmuramoyl-L-alanyl-D-glutamate--2,6-diaminopimelate ligase